MPCLADEFRGTYVRYSGSPETGDAKPSTAISYVTKPSRKAERLLLKFECRIADAHSFEDVGRAPLAAASEDAPGTCKPALVKVLRLEIAGCCVVGCLLCVEADNRSPETPAPSIRSTSIFSILNDDSFLLWLARELPPPLRSSQVLLPDIWQIGSCGVCFCFHRQSQAVFRCGSAIVRVDLFHGRKIYHAAEKTFSQSPIKPHGSSRQGCSIWTVLIEKLAILSRSRRGIWATRNMTRCLNGPPKKRRWQTRRQTNFYERST